MKKITKAQHQRLVRLLEYFDEVEWECIDQTLGQYNPYQSGSCFGAHVSHHFYDELKAFYRRLKTPVRYRDGRISSLPGKGHFLTAAVLWERWTGVHRLWLTYYGASYAPFGTKSWSRHPADVIRSILADVEVRK